MGILLVVSSSVLDPACGLVTELAVRCGSCAAVAPEGGGSAPVSAVALGVALAQSVEELW